MENVFIVNPMAGKGSGSQKHFLRRRQSEQRITELTDRIYAAAESLSAEVEVILTKEPGDAEKIARRLAETESDGLRIFACGGDGTLNEVINGASMNSKVQIGAVPIGTGNDTIRNFTHPDGTPITKAEFLDPKAQILGVAHRIDLLQYSGALDGVEQVRYCVNMINNGFDCNVVACAGRLKKKPLISGSFAYFLAVLLMLLRKEGIDLMIKADGKVLRDEPVLLCAVANGCYCGGGLKGVPMAIMDDGNLELSIIKNTKRRIFLGLLPSYAKGTYLETPESKVLVERDKFREVELIPRSSDEVLTCADGEIYATSGIKIRVVPGAIPFILPAKV